MAPTATPPTPTITTGSLTPMERADEAVHAANLEGIINGFMTLIPSVATVGLLVRNNATFAARTNWQSRTAMAIMPAMFISALTSEHKLSHRMRQMAVEAQHGTETVHWAEQQLALQQSQAQQDQASQNHQNYNTTTTSIATTTQQLASLYQQSVESSGVCIVPSLFWYHHVANYTAQYPFRVLSAIAIPSVAYIFYGRTEQQHLQLSQKIMHTRVLGQFTTISLLLTVMGCKEYLDRNGKYISQQQADDRVAEMHHVRQQFLYKMDLDKQHAAELKAELERAHSEDIQDAHQNNNDKKKKMKKKMMIQKKVQNNDDDGIQKNTLVVTETTPTTVME